MTTQQPEQQGSASDGIGKYVYLPPEQRPLILRGLIVGLLIGVLFGWFVLGWWLFPVNYDGEAYAHHLNEEAKADYLSAVADAYAARRDEAALALAQYRLRAFIGEGILDESIHEAQSYISELQSAMPGDAVLTRNVLEGGVRIDNLNLLEATLKPESEPSEATDAEQATAPAETSPTFEPTANQQDEAAQSSGGSSNNSGGGALLLQWLVRGFAAALIVGGIYLLYRLNQRRRKDDDGDDNNDGNRDDGGGGGTAGVTTAAYGVKKHVSTAGTPDDEDPTGQSVHLVQPSVDAGAHSDYIFGQENDANPQQPRNEETSTQPVPEDFDVADWPTDPDAPEENDEPAMEAGAAVPVTERANPSKLATYTAHYQAGVHDYQETFPLIDPETQEDVGKCGVGATVVPSGLRDKHPEDGISLDVWLVDKLDETQIGNYRRVLISEYVVDHDIESSFKGIQGAVGDPIVAQPGTKFNIEGHNLKVLCGVMEADYSDNGATKGAFTNVKVHMTVMKKR